MDWEAFFPAGTPVVALPSWDNPRLYMAAQDPLRRWEGSAFYPAFRPHARFYRLLLRARAAVGLVAVRVAQSEGWPVGAFIQAAPPHISSVAAQVGTPGPAQKITVQLSAEGGKVVGYLKYAEKAVACKRLQQEYEVLSGLPQGIGPRPLRYGSLGKGLALHTTPVQGKLLPAKLPPVAGFASFLQILTAAPPLPLEAHPWARAIRLPGEGCVERWLESLADRKWPVVIQHGDLAPWNLLSTPNGKLRAIDWEYGSPTGFPYVDLAQYMFQVAALLYRWSPSKAMDYTIRYLTRRPWPGLTSAEAVAIAGLAAYQAHRHALEDGHAPDAPVQAWRQAVWEKA
jgi:hypothetical protein